MKRFFTTVTLLSAFLLSCSNGTKNEENKDVVKVAVIEPVTGDIAQYGQAIKDGIELGIDEINNAGGVNGKKIEEMFADTKGDIQEAVNIFKKFASSGADIVLAESISANSAAIAELAQKAKIPMITPAGTALDITKDKDYIFRTTFTDPYQGEIIAKYLHKLGIKKVGLLVNNSSDYSVGVADAFRAQAKELGIELFEENYTNNDKDFKTILTKLKNAGITDVLIPDYYNTIGLMLLQAQEIGLKANYYGADGWDGIQENFADLAEGAIFATQFNINSDDEKTVNFVKNFREKYSKDPTIFAALGYDTAMILKEALSKGKDLKDAIKETNLDLVTGSIKFDENGNPQKAVRFLQLKDGKLILKEKFGE